MKTNRRTRRSIQRREALQFEFGLPSPPWMRSTLWSKKMPEDRQLLIESMAGDGDLAGLREILGSTPTQFELDSALENALAYSQLPIAEFLLLMGADIKYGNCQGAYYAAHNNELRGLKFAIANGVDINCQSGMLLVNAVVTAHNQSDTSILRWLLENGADLSRISPEGMRTISAFTTPQISSIINDHNKSCEATGDNVPS